MTGMSSSQTSSAPLPSTSSRQQWRRLRLLLLLIFLTAWALRLTRLDMQDIWWDEARNIDVATRALAQVAVAPELDIHPPLYFYGLHAWSQGAGVSQFSMRFFSVWFGMLGLALVYQLTRKLGRDRETAGMAMIAVLIAAVAPFALSEAQETRMYTLAWALLAAAQLALWAALDSRHQGPASWRRWALFVVLTAAALLTHYATAIVVLMWGVWLLVWALFSPQRRQRLRLLLGVGLGVIVLLVPVVPIALRQIPGYDNPNLVLPQLSQVVGQLARAFTVGEFAPPAVWRWGRWLWLLLVLGGLAGWRLRRRRHLDGQRLSLLALWLLGSLVVFYLILVTRSAFDARYISFILPALWALTAWACWGWRRWGRHGPWLAGLILLALSVPALHADLFDPAHFREDMSGVTVYLQEHSRPSDVILLDQRYPFGFYWQRWNNDFYGQPPTEPAAQAPAQYLFVDLTHEDQRRLDQRLTRLAGTAGHVFYVTWFESDMDPRGAVPALLNTFGMQTAEVHFRGYTVREWTMEPPTVFAFPKALVRLDRQFAQGVTLVAGDWTGRSLAVTTQHDLLVALQWQLQGPTPQTLKVSLRLKTTDGATLAQDDRLLLNDRHVHSSAWQAGETAINVYRVPAPPQAGDYVLTLVVYDAETLAPIGLADGGGVEPVIGLVHVAP